MPRRRKTDEDAPLGEANVLPVMNIMFLLIPALLLAMEVASMAAVAITPPQIAAGEGSPDEEPEQGLNLKVTILNEGFRVQSTEQDLGSDEPGRAVDREAPTLALAKPGAPLDDYARYDYAALEAMAQTLKNRHRDETVVTVTAEGDVPAQVLVSTLDALRGSDCTMAELREGEERPDTCLFFRPVVEG